MIIVEADVCSLQDGASIRLLEISLIIFTVVKFLTYYSDREFALGEEVSVESKSGEALADCCVLLTEQRCVCLTVCCPDKRSHATIREASWLKAFISYLDSGGCTAGLLVCLCRRSKGLFYPYMMAS